MVLTKYKQDHFPLARAFTDVASSAGVRDACTQVSTGSATALLEDIEPPDSEVTPDFIVLAGSIN
jgi:hypothetical protein